MRGIESWKITDESWWVFAFSAPDDSILQCRVGVLTKRGTQVRTRQFYFRKDGKAVFANLYSARLDEIVRLLMTLGNLLGQVCPPIPHFVIDEQLGEQYS
jgi:hypothetical protein